MGKDNFFDHGATAGVAEVDEQQETRFDSASKYPKLTIYIRPSSKARLEALSSLTGEPAWRIMEAAFEAYFSVIPEADRIVIDVIMKRKQDKELEAKAVAAGTA